jgi:hypothetical protein
MLLTQHLLKREVRTSPDRVGYLLADDVIELAGSNVVFGKRQIIEAPQRQAVDTAYRVLLDFAV